MTDRLSRILRIILESVTIGLVVALSLVVVAAVVARYAFNASFVWYDEVASIMLAWITFYGAGLAALRRRHLGFAGVMMALPRGARIAAFVVAELIVYAVFAALAYAGWLVLGIFGSETMVSLDVPLSVTQSALPIGAAIVILAQMLSAPQAWRDMLAGRSADDDEIEEELARAGVNRHSTEETGTFDGEPANAVATAGSVAQPAGRAPSTATTRRWSRR